MDAKRRLSDLLADAIDPPIDANKRAWELLVEELLTGDSGVIRFELSGDGGGLRFERGEKVDFLDSYREAFDDTLRKIKDIKEKGEDNDMNGDDLWRQEQRQGVESTENTVRRLEAAGLFCREYAGADELVLAIRTIWSHMTKLDTGHLIPWIETPIGVVVDLAMGVDGNRRFGEGR